MSSKKSAPEILRENIKILDELLDKYEAKGYSRVIVKRHYDYQNCNESIYQLFGERLETDTEHKFRQSRFDKDKKKQQKKTELKEQKEIALYKELHKKYKTTL